MSLVTSKEMLNKAKAEGYAVGAFNIENMEMAMAAVSAAEAMNSPIILQTTPSTVKYASAKMFAVMVKTLADASSVPIALHLDHGSSYELAVEALHSGYSSIMIDGSKLSLEDNIALTKKVRSEARYHTIPVEAELGTVGGKEDSVESDGNNYTDPEDAVRFVSETHCESLAIGIGTAHGIYKGTPILDLERLTEINESLKRADLERPLVLHGASGLSDETVAECIKRGICKVNFATELRQAYTAGVKQCISDDPDVFDPKKYGKVGMEQVKRLVMHKIEVCQSVGKC